MAYCSIRWCGKNTRTSSYDKDGITFHRFPKELEMKRKWIKRAKRDNWHPQRHSRVCSRHFTEDCFYGLKNRRRRLFDSAVPSLHLPVLADSALNDSVAETTTKPVSPDRELTSSPKQIEVEIEIAAPLEQHYSPEKKCNIPTTSWESSECVSENASHIPSSSSSSQYELASITPSITEHINLPVTFEPDPEDIKIQIPTIKNETTTSAAVSLKPEPLDPDASSQYSSQSTGSANEIGESSKSDTQDEHKPNSECSPKSEPKELKPEEIDPEIPAQLISACKISLCRCIVDLSNQVKRKNKKIKFLRDKVWNYQNRIELLNCKIKALQGNNAVGMEE